MAAGHWRFSFVCSWRDGGGSERPLLHDFPTQCDRLPMLAHCLLLFCRPAYFPLSFSLFFFSLTLFQLKCKFDLLANRLWGYEVHKLLQQQPNQLRLPHSLHQIYCPFSCEVNGDFCSLLTPLTITQHQQQQYIALHWSPFLASVHVSSTCHWSACLPVDTH